MAEASNETGFIVWGPDQSPYGPVDLSNLLAWVEDERVTAQTWIFIGETGAWRRAADVPELQMLLRPAASGFPQGLRARATLGGFQPAALRGIKVLVGMTDDQLERFVQFVELEKVPSQSVVVHQGEREDSIYLISEGEMRVRTSVMGQEMVLATLTAGDCFGDLAFLDHGARSADVVAVTDATLFKISGAAFDELARTSSDLATPLLRALDQTLTTRIRADNERFGDAVKHAHQAR